MDMARGKLIVFEGVCGVGKTTVARQLIDRLSAMGLQSIYNHGACTYTELGRRFHQLTEDMSVPFSTAFYLADLVQDTVRQIKPWLERGLYVIQDRYADSIIAYRRAWGRQSGESMDPSPVIDLYTELDLLEVPELTVWFQAPRQVLLGRLAVARPTSVHKRYLEDPVFLDLVQEEFERLTRAKDRWLTLSTVSPDDHAARILERLEVGPKVDKLDTRCGVIIIRDGKVAVIRKTLGPETFFNFPGGRGRTGESSGETAVREAFEELGLKIRLGPLVATWTSDWDGTHHYYLATEVEGEFGQGQGEDMMSGCTAMWMNPDELKTADVRPKDVALALPFHSLGELPSPLHLRETIRRRTPVDE